MPRRRQPKAKRAKPKHEPTDPETAAGGEGKVGKDATDASPAGESGTVKEEPTEVPTVEATGSAAAAAKAEPSEDDEEVPRRRRSRRRSRVKPAAKKSSSDGRAKGSSDAVASPSALSNMLNHTQELSALFDSLGVLGIALMACLSRGWNIALRQARAETPCVEDLDGAWLWQQLQLWNQRHYERVRHFRSNFLLSVLPRFYTGLRQLRLLPGSTNAQIDPRHRFMSVTNQALMQLISKEGTCSLNPNLRELDVRESGVDDVSLTIVAGGCRQLQKASFDGFGCLVSDVGLAALAQGCKQLQQLIIDRSAHSITHEGVMAVARSCRLLETLQLPASSHVEDEGLIALGQCSPQLRSLTCNGWARITDAAVIALASGCPLLEIVQLSHASITDASADALAEGCPNLKMLDLFQTRITAAGLLALAKHARQPRLSIRTSCEMPAAILKKYPNVEMFGLFINLKVVTRDGDEMHFKCKYTDPLRRLMYAWCNRQGVSTLSVRFLFDGSRINETQTVEQLDMEDGDVIDVMVEEQGDVGEWEPVHTLSGAEQLLLSAATEGVDPATALDIERTASGPHLSRRAPPASFESVGALLTTAQCARLVAHTERLASELPPAQRAALDAKLDVTAEELAQVVGPGVLASLMRLGAAQLSETHRAAHAVPSGLVLRRSAAAVDGGPARRIGWHHDWCLAVVSVALSDEHLGGRLLFLLDGQVHCQARPVGSAIAHNRSAVHGVSTITAGVRYNLIASFGDPKAADAA